MFRLSLAAALLVFPLALSAQWPDYASQGVPKGADGKPNLDAPPPRTADGHVDLSGVWENRRMNFGRGGGRGAGGRGAASTGGAAAPDAGATASATPPPAPASNAIPNATFGNIGAGFPEGLPLQPAAAKLLKQRKDENSKDNPDAHCLPMGLMQLHEHPQPRKIIQTPAVTAIIYEANSGLRQIFTDGRKLPPADAEPWWYGYSVGHWEGDTLVVETTGFRDDVWLDVNGSPLTNKGKMTEKYRRPTFGKLDIDVTIEDPSVYTKPFTVAVHQQIMLNTDLIEFICSENEKSDAHLVGR
jgi:hypothetical protein